MQDFIQNLPSDNIEAIDALIVELDSECEQHLKGSELHLSNISVESRAKIIVIMSTLNRKMQDVGGDVLFDDKIISYVGKSLSGKIERFVFYLRLARGKVLEYSVNQKLSEYGIVASKEAIDVDPDLRFNLPEAELAKVQSLLASVRETVFSSRDLDGKHKARILRRLASVEKELLQPLSRLDVVLAAASDIGDIIKKLGKDAKPAVDRMREVSDISRSHSSDVSLPNEEQLPQLPSPDSAP